MKVICLLTVALTVLAAHCRAATVTIDGTGIRQLRQATAGTPVLSGALIKVGYFFGMTDLQIIANQHNPTLLNSSFISFGLGGAVGQGAQNAAGYFTFLTSATVEAPAPTFTAPTSPSNSNQIYIWVFDSSSSPLAASQHAIFTSTASNWNWPTSDDGSTDRTISPDDNLTMLIGAADGNSVRLQAMPEPGSCALLTMGALAMLARRGGAARARKN